MTCVTMATKRQATYLYDSLIQDATPLPARNRWTERVQRDGYARCLTSERKVLL
jgi:hypothetical protein